MDRRWLLVPLVLLGGLFIAWGITRTPDLVRERRVSAPTAAAPPVAVAAGEPVEAASPGEPRRVSESVSAPRDTRYRLDPNFGKNGREDTPETKAAAASQKHWQEVIQNLSDQANSTPEATGLEVEVVALYDDLVFFRDDPDGKDWLALSQKSMRLNEKIRNVASLTDDADLHDSLDGVRSALLAFHGQQGQGQPGP